MTKETKILDNKFKIGEEVWFTNLSDSIVHCGKVFVIESKKENCDNVLWYRIRYLGSRFDCWSFEEKMSRTKEGAEKLLGIFLDNEYQRKLIELGEEYAEQKENLKLKDD